MRARSARNLFSSLTLATEFAYIFLIQDAIACSQTTHHATTIDAWRELELFKLKAISLSN